MPDQMTSDREKGMKGIAEEIDGTLVAADKYNHAIKFISSDADGRLVFVLGSGKPERGPYKFVTPEGVEVRGNTLWLSDSGNDRIVKYTLEE